MTNDGIGYSSPFSFRNRLGRCLWHLVWLGFCRWTPRPFHGWRRCCLRLFGARVGRHAHIYSSARIWAPWNLVLGDHACLADNVECYNQARITLGDRAIVSQRAFLCTGTHDHRDPEFPWRADPIVIDDGAWVCAQAYVGPGITIGARAVVGACAVVTKDVEPSIIVAGNPARRIGTRPDIRSSSDGNASSGCEREGQDDDAPSAKDTPGQ